MKAPSLRVLALASLPAVSACADSNGPTAIDTGFTVTVAPLQLDGIGDACYAIEIAGAQGTVVDLPEVCASDYGNGTGGDITYIAPCDASAGADVDPDATGGQAGVQNTVTVWPTLLDGNGVPLTDWEDPCGSAGCQLEATCAENADTLVEFNFTIMRDAQQGFFDVAVNFEDIFCSAKLDSCYDVTMSTTATATTTTIIGVGEGLSVYLFAASGKQVYLWWDGSQWNLVENNRITGKLVGIPGPVPPNTFDYNGTTWTLQGGTTTTSGTAMNLLHGANGREHTAVAALACTAGKDSDGTTLVMTAPTVACDGGVSFVIDLENAQGGNGTATWGEGNDAKTLSYALYFGEEDLDCGTGPGSCQKVYFNIAFNIDALAAQGLDNCRLVYGATAVETPENGFTTTTTFNTQGVLTDNNGVYPGIGFGPLQGDRKGTALTDTSDGLCFAHPLNGTGSAVQTGYIRGRSFTGTAPAFKGAFYYGGGTIGAFSE